MSLPVFLDTGPLGILTNPKRPPETVRMLTWIIAMIRAGHRFIVPAIADYEVRRELERVAKTSGLAALDMGLPPADFIVATVNVGHLALFVPAAHWTAVTHVTRSCNAIGPGASIKTAMAGTASQV